MCSANGSKEELYDGCSTDQYCHPELGKCTSDTCVGGEPACDGALLSSCQPDGSGAIPGGVACSQGSTCDKGQCKPVVCSGSYQCTSNVLYSCRGSGTELARVFDCGASQYCDAELGTCQTKLCEAGQSTCNNSVTTTCNDNGSAFLPGGTDCAATGKACKSGACLPLICTPNAYFCQTDDVMLCGKEGASSAIHDNCITNEFCEPGDSTCNLDVCTAASVICNGDLLTTCKANGSGPEAGGTDCTATAKVCDQAQCRAVVCEANQYFCGAGDVQLCNAKGWSSSLSDDCTTSEFCDSSISPPACWYDVCTANAASCNGESLATCNADGSGFASTTTNCATSSKVCDLVSGCVTSAVDSVGGTVSSTSGNSYVYGTYYKALKGRKLTQIEQFLSVSGTSVFTWLVYSSDTKAGPYSKVMQVATSSTGTSVYHGSGPLNFDLVAGKFYFIAVHVEGSHTAAYTSQGVTIQPVSFGQALGQSRITSGIPVSIASFSTSGTSAYPHRLTTAKP